MVQICESIMLICFGLSWPISVYKSIISKSTKGKSALFLTAILIGYLFGIIGKILGNNINYVLVLYIINFAIVSTDFILFFINKKRESKKSKIAENTAKNIAHKKEGVYNERRSFTKSQSL